MKRSIETWKTCDPYAMSEMSPIAIMFALQDMRADILSLHEALRKLWSVAEVLIPNEPIVDEVFDVLTSRKKNPHRDDGEK
jgi:hypothetical protein